MAARRKGKKKASEWGWRLGGLTLSGFFTLGLLAGLSASARTAAVRGQEIISAYRRRALTLAPIRFAHKSDAAPVASRSSGGLVALTQRKDGFYTLNSNGELSGPVSPDGAGDLPILSGPGLDGAGASQLVDYASILVRAEATLAAPISEMRLAGDGTASLFIQRSHTEIAIDIDNVALELARAARVMNRWRGHQEQITALDMTTPGQAVMRLRGEGGSAPGESAGRIRPALQGLRTASARPASAKDSERR